MAAIHHPDTDGRDTRRLGKNGKGKVLRMRKIGQSR